jgi:cyclopropane-fatty-acyl-phospholipid synthase
LGKGLAEVSHMSAVATTTDYHRWPGLLPPEPARVRTAAAKVFMRRVAERCGIRVQFADGGTWGPSGGPVLRIWDIEAMAARLGRAGEVGFGESYMAAEWDADDLVGVLEALARGVWTAVPSPFAWLRHLARVPNPQDQDNDLAGARRNIAHHYDLSNGLFARFLDETMTYSSGLFRDSSEPLAVAQKRKIDRILDAVGAGLGTRLLEIGSGWGELAVRAARRGSQVTTITLSEEQASLARTRVTAAGLDAQVEVRIQDYRDVQGLFDAIVSVEMIEAVGSARWATYLATLDRHLAIGGRVGLQTILADHGRMLESSRSRTWTRKYIFPGGVIPSEHALEESLHRHTGLKVVDRYRFGSSYARTLHAWRKRFAELGDEVLGLGFDRTFLRMWDFYLGQSEAGFRTGYLDVAQLVLSRSSFAGLSAPQRCQASDMVGEW